jgi:hypothetical protein
MANLSPAYFPVFRAFDANGNPLAGGKLYSYAAGTTTPLATYTDATGGTPNTNPVELDANGEASVWLGSDAYKVVLQDATGAVLWTVDGIKSLDELAQAYADTLRSDLANTSDPAKGAALIGYKSPLTGGTARTVYGKLQDTIDAADFGMSTTGDCTAALAAAVAAAAGKVLIIPPGSYTSTTAAAIAIPSGTTIMGYGATIISSGSANLFIVTDTDSVTVEGLKLVGPNSASYFGIYGATGATDLRVTNCEFSLWASGLYLPDTASRVFVTDNYFHGNLLTGFSADNISYCFVRGNTFEENGGTVNLTHGLYLAGFSDSIIEGNFFRNNVAFGFNANTATPKVTKNSVIANNVFVLDNGSTTAQGGLNVGGSGTIQDVIIRGNLVVGHPIGIGVAEVARPVVSGNTIIGCTRDAASTGYGIYLACTTAAAADLVCTGNTIIGGAGNAILIGTSNLYQKITIQGNVILNNTGYGVTSRYTVSNAQNVTIVDNRIENNTAGSILAGLYTATGNVVKRNIGPVTEAAGTGTIASGSTYVDVTHGLSYTPVAGEIHVVPTAVTTADFGYIYVSNIGATTFRVNCKTDPSTSGLAFAWSVAKV